MPRNDRGQTFAMTRIEIAAAMPRNDRVEIATLTLAMTGGRRSQ